MRVKRTVSVAATLLHNIEKALASEMPNASKARLAQVRWHLAVSMIANEATPWFNRSAQKH